MATLVIENCSLAPGLGNEVRVSIIWNADGKLWAENVLFDNDTPYITVWETIETKMAELRDHINTTYQITCQDGTVLTWP